MSMMKRALEDETINEIKRVSRKAGVEYRLVYDFFLDELEKGSEWYDALWDSIDFAWDMEGARYEQTE